MNFMRVFFRTLKFCMAFFLAAILLEAAGFGLFSASLFTVFGFLFFFAAFFNEFSMISFAGEN